MLPQPKMPKSRLPRKSQLLRTPLKKKLKFKRMKRLPQRRKPRLKQRMLR